MRKPTGFKGLTSTMKIKAMKNKIVFLSLLLSIIAFGQEKNKIAIIGTFHFHLVKPQFGVDLNILSKDRQTQLNTLAEQIAMFKPTKIFVEWEYTKQSELDELYSMYQKDRSFELIKKKYGENETMYFESEVQQLGFRIADKSGHKKVFAFDYLIPEPNDTIMNSIQRTTS